MTESVSQDKPHLPGETEFPAAKNNVTSRRFWFGCRIIGASWFVVFHLAAALKLAPKIGIGSSAHFQAMLLGLWCGVGTGRLWFRILVVAVASFYFDWMTNAQVDRDDGVGGVLGILILATAVESGLFRSLLGLVARRRWGQFSLLEILATTGATSMAIVMWRTPVEQMLQVMPRSAYFGLIGLFVLWPMCISLLSWATFYDDPLHRRRAFVGMLFLTALWAGLYLTFIGLATGWRTRSIWEWVISILEELPLIALTVYSAEAAFCCLGLRFTRSLDEDSAMVGERSTPSAVSEPLDWASESAE